MRLFTAISIADEARQHLIGIQRTLQDIDEMIGQRVTWVQPANLHITLKFLGEVNDVILPDLQEALGGVPIEPVRLFVDRLECFPSRGPIRVIAAGVGGGAGRVQRLLDQVEVAVEVFGIKREARAFTPHVTLARARDGIRRAGSWERQVVADRFPGPVFDTGGFELVKSTLTSAGSRYETIEKYLS